MSLPLVVVLLAGYLGAAQAAVSDTTFIAAIEMPHVEFYDGGPDDRRYGFYLDKVTWDEAAKICEGQKGQLVEYLDAAVGKFIGRALAESAVGDNSLWIGGILRPKIKKWMWASSNAEIPLPAAADTFPMATLPFWVDRPGNSTVNETVCLATARQFHHLPVIVSHPCNQRRPFICTAAAVSGGATQLGPPLYLRMKEFYLFHGFLTWNQALSKCRELGLRLAVLRTNEEFRAVSQRMLRSRPIMEMAWIGGAVQDKEWRWVTGDNVPIDSKNSSSSLNAVPWYRPNERIYDGCLLADRHLCDRFVFVEADCNRKRDYICEKEVPEKPPGSHIRVTGFPRLWFGIIVRTWVEAQSACKLCLEGELLQITELKPEEMRRLKAALFTATTRLIPGFEERHLWIGGYLMENTFYWSKSVLNTTADAKGLTEVTEANFQFNLTSTEGGFISYCPFNSSTESYLLEYKCLNMDREDQKHFFMYGLDCGFKQRYICQTKNPNQTLATECKVELGGLDAARVSTPIAGSPTTAVAVPSTTVAAATTKP